MRAGAHDSFHRVVRVFPHFGWDVTAVAAEMLMQKGATKDRVLRLPTILVRL